MAYRKFADGCIVKTRRVDPRLVMLANDDALYGSANAKVVCSSPVIRWWIGVSRIRLDISINEHIHESRRAVTESAGVLMVLALRVR
jgi:hypothetical protein